jgi:hypothetical protein
MKKKDADYINYLKNKYPANVCNDYMIAFIHVPKTGGNLIKKSIGTLTGDSHLSCGSLPPGLFKNLWSFAFVRNPYDRCASAFNYLLKGGKGNKSDLFDQGKFISKYKSFEDFILNGGIDAAILRQTHFFQQSKFIDDRIDFIGKYENIKMDWFKICKLNKIYKRLLFKEELFSTYDNLYTSEMRKKVYNIYMEDFEKFKYSSFY